MRSHGDRIVCYYMQSEFRGSEKGDKTTTTFSLIDYCGGVIFQLAQKDKRRSSAFEKLSLADIGEVFPLVSSCSLIPGHKRHFCSAKLPRWLLTPPAKSSEGRLTTALPHADYQEA